MTLAVPIYLAMLGVSLVDIGAVFFGMMVFNTVLVIALGVLGDMYGYKQALLISELVPAACALAIGISTNLSVIIIAIIIGGIGGSSGGLRGAFSPGMSALVANNWGDEGGRTMRLGQIMAVAPLFSMLGAFMISAHGYLSAGMGQAEAFRALYIVAGLLLAASFVSLLFVREAKRRRLHKMSISKSSRKYMLRVMAATAVTSAGLGVALPILPLWFILAYGASTFWIGAVYGVSYALTAAGSYAASRMSPKHNLLNIAYKGRAAGGAFLIAMAFAPAFAVAAAIYFARALISGFSAPTRSTVDVRGISQGNYGIATSLQGASSRLAQASSGASGYFLEYALPLPLVAGGVLEIAGGLLYGRILRYRDPEKI